MASNADTHTVPVATFPGSSILKSNIATERSIIAPDILTIAVPAASIDLLTRLVNFINAQNIAKNAAMAIEPLTTFSNLSLPRSSIATDSNNIAADILTIAVAARSIFLLMFLHSFVIAQNIAKNAAIVTPPFTM